MSESDTPAEPLPRLIATDFYAYLRPSECERRIWLKTQEVEEAPPGPYNEVLIRLGRENEARHLQRFPNALDLGNGSITERVAATREAIEAHERPLYQATFRAETTLAGHRVEIVGVPDFLLPARRGYAIRDSKLNRRIHAGSHVALQLETYGWLYEQTTGEPPISLQIHSGSGEIHTLAYEGGAPALEAFERILAARLATEQPDVPVMWGRCASCTFFDHCWPPAEERKDISLLSNMDQGLVRELHSRGIRTRGELFDDFDVANLAAVERTWGRKRMEVGERKATGVLAAARAAAQGREIVIAKPEIPDSPNYVMFDLEGMPPQLDELEKIYLWGMQVFGENPGEYRAATAGFGPRGDREGWEAFLREADAIFAEHGDIPFCHWASYELAKLNMYISRFGDRDGIAARVRRNLCDLYPITTDSVAFPFPSYGLKQVEQHVGFERTQTDFGGDVAIAAYIEATETDDEQRRAEIMERILVYNREDLEATWAVMKWLARTIVDEGKGQRD